MLILEIIGTVNNMSDYVKEKVLRIPVSKQDILEITSKYEVDYLWDLEFKINNFDYGEVGKFQVAPTCGDFIDYVLDYEYGADFGDYGKVRELTEHEKEKYKPIFYELWNGLDINKVRLVEFCWYNCCEAPDYYEIKSDKFYDEV